MKKINNIILLWIIICGTLFSSCADFLKENPNSTFTDENYFVDAKTLDAGVVGIYKSIIDLYVINTNTPIFLSMLGTDELCYRSSNTNIRSIIDRHTYTSTEGSIGELWARYYKLIGGSNAVIEAALRLDNLSGADRNRILGEAYYLRAWSYFQLVQFFGDLPLIKNKTVEFDYGVPRSPLSEVYKLIVSDLNFAVTDGVMPVEIKDGHANHWAAKTLLAKVYLTMASAKECGKVAGYAQIEESPEVLYRYAYDLLDDVMVNSGRGLLPVYSDVFKIGNKNKNVESIWEIQFSSMEPYGTQWSKEMGLTNAGYAGTDAGWRFCSIGGQYMLNALPSFKGYYCGDEDVRKGWNLMDSLIRYDAKTGVPTSMSHINTLSGIKGMPLTDNTNTTLVTRTSVTKYRWGNNWKTDYPIPYIYSNCPNNIIALRFADVLLMFTEADMALNGGKATIKGLEAINRVIQRARGVDQSGMPLKPDQTPLLQDYTEQTLTREALMTERARELCFEFWRRHDLARTGMFEYFLKKRDEASNVSTSFNPSKNYLLPIPQYERDNSENKDGMYQNPNY